MATIIVVLLLSLLPPEQLWAKTFGDCLARLARAVGSPPATSRIRLRSVTDPAGQEALGKLLRSPEMGDFIYGQAVDEAILEHSGSPTDYGDVKFLRYGVYLGEEIVGTANMGYSPNRKRASIGYAIDPRYQGRGLATEAARLLVRTLIDNFEIIRISALIHEDNPASLAVIKKIGFSSRAEPTEEYPGHSFYYLDPANFVR